MTTRSPPPDEEDDEEEEDNIGGGGGEEGSTTNTKIRCKDCGNQAKRDCQHSRCRTCCKSHGFHCPTHIKSTWVPVSDRRPRPLTRRHHFLSPNPKRICCNQNPPLLGYEKGGNFPVEVSVPAVFRCVRVISAMDEGVNQYAYQTSVRIGGRMFTGILYDQGADLPDVSYMAAGVGGGGGGGTGGGIELFQNPNFGNGSTTSSAGGTTPLFPYVIGLTGAAHTHLFQYPKY